MRAQGAAGAESRGFADQALLWLDLLALAIGALQFAFAPHTVERPLLALVALVALAAGTLLIHLSAALRRRVNGRRWANVLLLIACITVFAAATGAARSALLSLYVIPLMASALAFGRWWLVVLLGCLVGLLGAVLGAITPGVVIEDPAFAVLLFNTFSPAIVVGLVIAVLVERMQMAAQRISDLASTDALTGLLNLRAFEEVLQQEHRKAERAGRTYALLMIDVENLAQVNETLGHDAGNHMLRSVADSITRSIRSSDVAARFGGDEFIVLLVEADGRTGAAIGQRIRNNVYAATVSVGSRLIRANVNVGVASYPEDHLYPKDLMLLADQRMQRDRELRRVPAS
ncbi:MAG TPA: GGDEF domain-containing protein [Steroidobacteraceae bacterium]|jgi:diguanylate cyclase (GGDEF)-like protein